MEVKYLTLGIRIGHLNDECQCDLNVQLFDVGDSNVECQNDINIECQNDLNVKLFDVWRSNNEHEV